MLDKYTGGILSTRFYVFSEKRDFMFFFFGEKTKFYVFDRKTRYYFFFAKNMKSRFGRKIWNRVSGKKTELYVLAANEILHF